MNVMAHRGLSSRAPENTLAAFHQAIELGCEWIELDVQLTADHIPVVIHDQTICRCTNGQGKVSELTLAQLQSYDAGSWFAPHYADQTIPTFEDTLQLVAAHGVRLNVELKPYPGDDVMALSRRVAEVLKKQHTSASDILFSSFSIPALQAVQQQLPDIPRGLLWNTMPENAFDILKQLQAYSVHCDYRHLTEHQARAIKARGYRIYCYTPNDPSDVEAYWDWGVDNMISDAPDRYQSLPATRRESTCHCAGTVKD